MTSRSNTSALIIWKTAGFWLALALAVSQLVNAWRVILDAESYAIYMGLPLRTEADMAWVYVYALRALFLGCFAGYLLLSAQYRVLSQMALIAVLMPVGDFYLVWQDGAAGTTMARHAIIALALLAAWHQLRHLATRIAVSNQ